jgi:hypothetical protein
MSLIVPDFTESVVVRHAAAEVIGQQPITIRLLADSSSTGGALSTPARHPRQRSRRRQAAPPHQLGRAVLPTGRHRPTAFRRPGGDRRTRRPSRRPARPSHAFAAAPGHNADILIVITPGVERFEYFRHLERIAYDKVPPESLLEVQELYDTYFRTSPTWDAARPGPKSAI